MRAEDHLFTKGIPAGWSKDETDRAMVGFTKTPEGETPKADTSIPPRPFASYTEAMYLAFLVFIMGWAPQQVRPRPKGRQDCKLFWLVGILISAPAIRRADASAPWPADSPSPRPLHHPLAWPCMRHCNDLGKAAQRAYGYGLVLLYEPYIVTVRGLVLGLEQWLRSWCWGIYTIDCATKDEEGRIIELAELKSYDSFAQRSLTTAELFAAVGKATLRGMGIDLVHITLALDDDKAKPWVYIGCGFMAKKRQEGEIDNRGAELRAHVNLLACLLACKRDNPEASVKLVIMRFHHIAGQTRPCWAPDEETARAVLAFWLGPCW